MAVRRALFISAADRYASMLLGALVVAAVSRLLSPEEVGVTVLGLTLFALVDIIRDVPSGYLLQCREATRDAARTAFTLMLAVSIAAATVIWLAAPAIAEHEGEPSLLPFLRVIALALLIGPFERPLTALLRRDMAFDRVAIVNVTSAAANGLAMVALAALGFSYMSFAWALLASNLVSLAVALACCRRWDVLFPSLRCWHEALRIGAAAGLWGLTWRFTESLPQITFGALGALGTAGIYGRAQTMVEMPGKLLFAVVSSVALPAMAMHQRNGQGLKRPFLDALALLSALHWPAFLMLACLAHPITMLLLGPQWVAAVPVLQLLALSRLLAPIDILVYPILMARGASSKLLLQALIPMPIHVLLVLFAAPHGALAVAACFLLLAPFDTAVSYACIRRLLRISPGDLVRALWRSGIVALASAMGPALVAMQHGFRLDFGLSAGLLAGLLGAGFWLCALFATRHPLSGEFRRTLAAVRNLPAPRLGARS